MGLVSDLDMDCGCMNDRDVKSSKNKNSAQLLTPWILQTDRFYIVSSQGQANSGVH